MDETRTEEYAELTVVFLADPALIDNPVEEGKLSDEYSRIADELNDWLKHRTKFSRLAFRVNVE